ncbi:hypothetical protein BKA61DRAFT_702991, partial [Leptodontidium sp. MPI-SDFR-AT-0119]
TGIPARALRGSPLSDFSVAERLSWAASRETFRQEDKAYSLLGIFDINMPLIYSEGKEKAMNRLREEIDKASKGFKREDFSVTFSLSDVFDVEHFVARETSPPWRDKLEFDLKTPICTSTQQSTHIVACYLFCHTVIPPAALQRHRLLQTELAEIHKALSCDGSRSTVILHCLGGIGKTQLAAAYAKRHKDSYSAIFWLNIKDEDSLKQSFVKVAKQILREHPSALQLSNVDTKENLGDVVDAVKAWLSLPNNTRWLMIYDNYDNPKLPGKTDPAAVDIRKYLPESYQGSIIITTRSSHVKNGHVIYVRKLEEVRDSLEILSNASRRKGLVDDPDAIKLAEKELQ